MVPQISAFPNRIFYGGELVNAQKVLALKNVPLLPPEVFKYIEKHGDNSKKEGRDVEKLRQKCEFQERRFAALCWIDTCNMENNEEEMTPDQSRCNPKESKILFKHLEAFLRYCRKVREMETEKKNKR